MFPVPVGIDECRDCYVFNLIIHQFVKVYEAAVEHKNNALSKLVVRHLQNILLIFSRTKENLLFVKNEHN